MAERYHFGRVAVSANGFFGLSGRCSTTDMEEGIRSAFTRSARHHRFGRGCIFGTEYFLHAQDADLSGTILARYDIDRTFCRQSRRRV